MSVKHDAFVRNDTFNLVDRYLATNIVGSCWLYMIKRNPDGTIKSHKYRLVARGNHQRPGVELNEIFSPVIKHATIRLVLGTTVAKGWPLQQLDVNNAFLQGPLHDEVYMLQAPGFVDKDKPNHVYRLKKAVYGLRQAPRAWYTALKEFLVSIGFKNSRADASLFVLQHGSVFVYILIHVDDIIITGTSTTVIKQVIDRLAAKFSLKDLGELSYFLGLEAHRRRRVCISRKLNMLLTCFEKQRWKTQNQWQLQCPRLKFSHSTLVRCYLIHRSIELPWEAFNIWG